MLEAFELELAGGAIERRYRRAAPEVEALPWELLDPADFAPEDVAAARGAWTGGALQEYRSTNVHAEALLDMVRVRMPLDLTAMSTRFQLEELVHAELCARVAMRLGGGAELPYTPRPSPPRRHARFEMELADRATWAFAVSETYSHAMLAHAHARAKHPFMRALRGLITKDEAAHGRHGWTILELLLPELTDPERAHLRAAAAAAIAQLRTRADAMLTLPATAFGELAPLGPFTPDEYRTLAHATLDGVHARLATLSLA